MQLPKGFIQSTSLCAFDGFGTLELSVGSLLPFEKD